MPFKPTDYLPYDFANRRHIGPSPAEMAHMLETLGLSNLEGLIDETLPKSIRQKKPLNFGKPKSERALLNHMRITASKNSSDQSNWSRLSWNSYTSSNSKKYFRKPGMVYGLHTLST